MINEVLHSRLIAFVMGLWSMYCGSIGDYDGEKFILFFFGLMLLLNHLDQKKSDSAANTNAQQK